MLLDSYCMYVHYVVCSCGRLGINNVKKVISLQSQKTNVFLALKEYGKRVRADGVFSSLKLEEMEMF